MLHLTNWQGDETNWITLTVFSPDDTDSEQFDEGVSVGFHVPVEQTQEFVAAFLILMTKVGVSITLHGF